MIFLCSNCNKEFKSQYTLNKHLNRKNPCINNNLVINEQTKITNNIVLNIKFHKEIIQHLPELKQQKIMDYYNEQLIELDLNIKKYNNLDHDNKILWKLNSEIIN